MDVGTPEWTQEAWIIDDGIVLHNSVLLNGSNAYGWNKSKSLVHEAGHVCPESLLLIYERK